VYYVQTTEAGQNTVIEYEERPKKELTVVKKICDSCSLETTKENKIEWNNFHHLRFVTSKGSIFGAGVDVKIDLCQHCMYERIKTVWEKRKKIPNKIKKL